MTVRLFHVSDLHFGTEDRAAIDWFGAVVAAERPDLVCVTGDLTAAARSSEFAAAAAWLATFEVPVTVEPGNHDMPVYNPLTRLFFPTRRFRQLERRIERPVTLAGCSLVPLVTATRAQLRFDWSLGVVRPASLRRTLAEIARRPAGNRVIVACHHPLVDVAGLSTPGRTLGGLAALEALAAAGADGVLSGHTHDPFDIAWQGAGRPIRLIGAGTLSARVRASRPSFNEIRLGPDVFEVRVRTLPG